MNIVPLQLTHEPEPKKGLELLSGPALESYRTHVTQAQLQEVTPEPDPVVVDEQAQADSQGSVEALTVDEVEVSQVSQQPAQSGPQWLPVESEFPWLEIGLAVAGVLAVGSVGLATLIGVLVSRKKPKGRR